MALNIIILMTNLEIRILQMMALMNYVMTLVLVNHYKAQIGGDLHGTGAFYLHFCLYSHLSNNRGGWNKCGGEAKIAKSLNVEAGINVEVGKYL